MIADDQEPVRVLEVITALDVGGAELQLLGRVKIALAAGMDVTVCSLTRGGSLAEEFAQAGAKVIELGSRHLLDPRPALPLARLLRTGRYDVVHAHLFRARIWAVPLSRGLQVPLVLQSEHALTRSSFEARPHNRLNQLAGIALGRLSHRTIAISRDTAAVLRELHRVPPARIVRVANGIERPVSQANRGSSAAAVDVTALGRLHEQKGFEDLIEAIALLEGRNRAVNCELAGAGPLEGALLTRIEELGLGSSVRLVGVTRDPIAFIRRGRVFAMPSRSEAFGIAALEAMTAGVPIVASDVDALPELVGDGETGLVVPVRDPAALAAALERLLTDEGLRLRLAGNAAAAVERYDLRRSTERLLRVYEDAVSAPAQRTGT